MKKIVAILLIGMSCMACRIIKPTTEVSKIDTTSVAYKQQSVDVKGGKVDASLDVNALIDALTSYKRDSANAAAAGHPIPVKPKTTGTVTDAQGKAQLTYWVDQFGKLQMSCESKDQTVNVLVGEVTRLSKEVSKKTEIAYQTPVWNWIAMSVLSTLLVVALLIIFLRK
ncbi:hypothetical protein [Pedobacter sp. MW01-1-1]|uniref:hypothetical protein n=1 Tax=Pedobacter sp. MW01-1-1 TaxID=3383027 RepID=UPI003FEE1FCF